MDYRILESLLYPEFLYPIMTAFIIIVRSSVKTYKENR